VLKRIAVRLEDDEVPVKTLTIDGELITAPSDRTILDAAREHGVKIPTLCHLDGVSEVGAKNVSYEGMRCATRERKLYAVGRSDGSWAPSHNKNWEVISEANANRQHAELMKEYLCPDKAVPKDAKEILERLKRGSRCANASFGGDAEC